MSIKARTEDRIFNIMNALILSFLVIVTLYPFINTLAVSLNQPLDTVRGGIYLWPRQFTWINYEKILAKPEVYMGALTSFLRTLVGPILTVTSCLMVAYGISRKDFVLRKFVTTAFILTMYFSGGLIPYYFLIRGLHMINSFFVYVIPPLVNAWYILVIRSYISELPESIIESAKIDGASEIRILRSIIFPLCIPVLATMVLFAAVDQWNSWFDTMLFCPTVKELTTLQFELQKVLQTAAQMRTVDYTQALTNNNVNITPTSIRAAMTIIVTIPIAVVYPFLQKYFIKGLT
ncbi:MAG TPA: carbohydrate ABC transporter permease, partial [Bacillota bacterium]|nr:carbohydrate ABC transporter permease [Bacillota bacterium]